MLDLVESLDFHECMTDALKHFLATIKKMKADEEAIEKEEDVIQVSDTVSVAASVYETMRNALEYDEEHLLRRNAIHRIMKRRLGDQDVSDMAAKLLRELIWAKYLPNGKVPTRHIEAVRLILEKYQPLFNTVEPDSEEGQRVLHWLLDVVAVEIEHVLGPPCGDESLASFAYQELRKRIDWQTKTMTEEERDLQLYIGIHRSVLKSNRAALRHRVFTLYYPKWSKAKANDAVVKEISMSLSKVVDSVEQQIEHPAQDTIYRFIRRHAVVFRLLSDIAKDNPEALAGALASGDVAAIDTAISKAAAARYTSFRKRLKRTVVRACAFLLITKTFLAFLIEYPYEVFILGVTDYVPLMVNIFFPPILLAIVALSVRIDKKKNNAKILEELHAILGFGDDFKLVFKRRSSWGRGAMWWIFNGLYVGMLLLVISVIAAALTAVHFNAMSIFFFIFFLSVVAYFGIRIRNTRRELMVLELSRGIMPTLLDILFLPVMRAGRWVSLRAPRVNVFLFFFDFIIEAPFKAAIGIVESWLVFLREKREEI